jgi:molybdenum-dependent DNA-binding transcriptional regulator ModE
MTKNMGFNYQKVWDTMNELEMVSSKVCSAREILDSAIDALQNHKVDKAETLMYAANEFLEYYLKEFDDKFKDAWANTVVAVKNDESTKLTESTSDAVVDDKLEELFDKAEKFYDRASHKLLTYQEAVDAGYSMTDDGFWIPPQKNEDLYVYSEEK